MPYPDSETEDSMVDIGFLADQPSTIAEDLSDAAAVAALQRELADARPRLEAFAALEALAEQQATSPEAVAIRASIEMLEAEQQAARAELERVQGERDDVIADHAAVVDELAEMLEELEAIRADAVRLLGEKAELERRVETLRDEVGAAFDTKPHTRPPDIDVAGDDDEATAFDRFFEADVEEDKARAWMLE